MRDVTSDSDVIIWSVPCIEIANRFPCDIFLSDDEYRNSFVGTVLFCRTGHFIMKYLIRRDLSEIGGILLQSYQSR